MSDTSHLQLLVDILKREANEKTFIDVGANIERNLPVSSHEFDIVLAMLEAEGYPLHIIRLKHLGSKQKVIVKVVTPPDITQRDVFLNRMDIQPPNFKP